MKRFFLAAIAVCISCLALAAAPNLGNPSYDIGLAIRGLPVIQTFVPHTSNLAGLETYNSLFNLLPVVRDGYGSAGDGGRATYTHSTSACSLNSGAGDTGSQVIDAAGTGCWNVDWASVNFVASMPLFGCTGNATDCTVAFEAALATGRSVYFPAGYYLITAGVNSPGASGAVAGATVTTAGQHIYGDGRSLTKVDCRLASSAGTTNPCLTFAVAGGLAGPDITDMMWLYGLLPDTTATTDKVPYGPIFYGEGTPGVKLRRLRLERAYVDGDFRGNTGQFDADDIEYNCMGQCFQGDGALDSWRFHNGHGWPFDLTDNQKTILYTYAVAFDFGYMDDFRISDSLWIGHLAFNLHSNIQTVSVGQPNGGIVNFQADTHSFIQMSAGNVEAANIRSTPGTSSDFTAQIYGGSLDITSLHIDVGASLGVAFFVGGSTVIPRVTVNGGTINHLGTVASQFDVVDFLVGTTGNPYGELTLSGLSFQRVAGTSSNPACNQNATVLRSSSGRLTMLGNRMTDLGAVGTGTCPNKFISISSDSYDRVIGNVAPGWTNTLPASPVNGVYQFNGGTATALPTTSN